MEEESPLDEILHAQGIEGKAEELMRHIQEGRVLKDVLGLTQERMAKRYGYANDLFEMEEYEDAAAIFTHLAMLDPRISQYWRGAAVSHIRAGQLDRALILLSISSAVNPDDPRPHFESGLCHVRLGQNEEAVEAFEEAVEAAQKDHAYDEIGGEAKEWLRRLGHGRS